MSAVLCQRMWTSLPTYSRLHNHITYSIPKAVGCVGLRFCYSLWYRQSLVDSCDSLTHFREEMVIWTTSSFWLCPCSARCITHNIQHSLKWHVYFAASWSEVISWQYYQYYQMLFSITMALNNLVELNASNCLWCIHNYASLTVNKFVSLLK